MNFRDKEEASHEAPWIAFLPGHNADYSEQALAMALGQVARRSAPMERERPDRATMHIHFWQVQLVHRIDAAEAVVATKQTYPGPITDDVYGRQETETVEAAVGGNRVVVVMPPNTQVRLRLRMKLNDRPVRHQAL